MYGGGEMCMCVYDKGQEKEVKREKGVTGRDRERKPQKQRELRYITFC